MWRGYPDEGCYDTRSLTGLWSTQLKVKDTRLKVAWNWISDRSIVNDRLGELGCTQPYVGLPSARAPWTVTIIFPHLS